MDIKTFLDSKVSFQTSTWSPLSGEMTVRNVLEDIERGKYSNQIGKLRIFLEKGQNDLYNIYKKRLPAVTFCATFEKYRRKEYLKDYNRLIVIDIDKLQKEEFARVKGILEAEGLVFAFWESPSKIGFKGLVGLTFEVEINTENIEAYHKTAFSKLKAYFLEKYNIELDDSGSDTTRLCFLSYDTNLMLKEEYSPFYIEEMEMTPVIQDATNKPQQNVRESNFRDKLYNPLNKNMVIHRIRIEHITRFLKGKKRSITRNYESWYKVAYAIANSFTYDVGEKYYLKLCELDAAKFDKISSQNMLLYCYENNNSEISFGTIEYLAKQEGYSIKTLGEGVV